LTAGVVVFAFLLPSCWKIFKEGGGEFAGALGFAASAYARQRAGLGCSTPFKDKAWGFDYVDVNTIGAISQT